MVGHVVGDVVRHVAAHLELGVNCVSNKESLSFGKITRDRNNFAPQGAQRAHVFCTCRRRAIVVADVQFPLGQFSLIIVDEDQRAVLGNARTAAKELRVRSTHGSLDHRKSAAEP